MFKDKLTADLNKLCPADETKSAILNKINAYTPKKIINFKSSSVIAACLALVIAIGVFASTKLNNDDLAVIEKNVAVDEHITTISSSAVNNSAGKNSKPKESQSTTSAAITASTAIKNNTSGIYDNIYKIIKNKYKETVLKTAKYGFSKLEEPGLIDTNTSETSSDYSKTNTQHEDVDEEDIIKTDGKYIYRLNTESDTVVIYKADGKNTKKISSINLSSYLDDYYYENKDDEDYSDSYASGMYYYKDRLVVIYNTYTKIKALDCKCDICKSMNFDDFTQIFILDISNPKKGKYITNFKQSGYYDTSRMIDDKLYISSTSYIYAYDKVKKKETTRYLPVLCQGETQKLQEEQNIYISDDLSETTYSMICSYDITSSKRIDDKSFFGNSNLSYVSNKNLYFTEEIYDDNYETVKTKITRFSIKDGRIEKKATGSFAGDINDQFSMDEKNGYLRLVATQNRWSENSYNSLCILDSNMETVSTIKKLAKGERIYSARFIGDYAYFVTFKETDPLFCADISDPKNPKIVCKLKIPGFSDYLHPYGNNKLFGFGQSATDDGEVTGLKLSMFDITDKKNITEENVIELDTDFSEANYNHKAIVISNDKSLIAFSAYAETYNQKKDWYVYQGYYYIYSYSKKDGFTKLAKIKLNNDNFYNFDSEVRGLYIGENFYISTGKRLIVVSLKNYEIIKNV